MTRTARGLVRLARSPGDRTALVRALRDASYEILPFRNTEEQVLASVPKEVRLTVTTTEVKGLEPTIALTARLACQGYSVAPHLAARLVRDAGHLDEVVSRLEEAGVEGIFVIGGDSTRPAGVFP